MAQILGDGTVKLESGAIVTPKQGEWLDGMHYFNGTLSQKGQENPLSGTPTAGQMVSKEVIQQTNPANWEYLHPGAVSAASLGIPGATGAPTLDLQSIYSSAFNTPEIKAAQDELNLKTKARDEALAAINDNPFYVEATRVGKQAKVSEATGADLTRIQNQLAQLKSDAEIKVNIATKQYDINNQAYKDNLSLFNSLLSAGGLTGASTADLAKYSVATGIPVSMLQGVLNKQAQTAATGNRLQTDTITQTDDKGNVTIAIIDTQTGKVIAKNSLGKIGKSSLIGEVIPFSKLSAADQANINKIKDGIKNKLFTREEAVAQFPEYAPYF